jgi:hypothetical protein
MNDFKLIKLILSMCFIMGFINAQIEGSWKVSPEAGALMVGPSAGSGSWWSNSEADVTTRSCYFNDEYVFNADGSFTNDLGAETWIEGWQGGSDACGAPVAPHDGSNSATWYYDGSTITLDGTGAYLGLSKVYNSGELTSPDGAPSSITYEITLSDNDETMNLSINAGGTVWWSFKLVTSASIPENPCADISCGPGETCVDGVCVESQDVNVTFNLVTLRILPQTQVSPGPHEISAHGFSGIEADVTSLNDHHTVPPAFIDKFIVSSLSERVIS